MILEKRHTFELVILKDFLRHFIQRKSQLLILVIRKIRPFSQIGFLFRSNHFFHHFHCRIVFTAISLPFLLYQDFFDHFGIRNQLNIKITRLGYLNLLCLVTDHRKYKCTFFKRQTVISIQIRRRSMSLSPFIINVYRRQCFSGFSIGHTSCHILCDRNLPHHQTHQT